MAPSPWARQVEAGWMSPESVRASLLGELDAITSPQAAMEFQRRLAGELLSAEPAIDKGLMLSGTGTFCA